jgi:hypothetical protein
LHKEIESLLTIDHVLLSDPPKKKGDFWTLCKAWNKAYAYASGELIVNIQDWTWIEADTLERFWNHFQSNPKAIVSACGNHYDSQDSRGRPENLVWVDPRLESEDRKVGSVGIEYMEMSVCSIPRQAILDCGGIDEIYDTCNGVQEKEMCLRLRVLGYETFVDQTIEYRGMQHGRLSKDWDDVYWNKTEPLFKSHVHDMMEGVRKLNVGCLSKYNKTVNT